MCQPADCTDRAKGGDNHSGSVDSETPPGTIVLFLSTYPLLYIMIGAAAVELLTHLLGYCFLKYV